ncbi:MAG: SH3 domain-containing protein [Gammaproteobacteria bacterium]|nr:SH3 domain-containing protein [Gammaproteobacteria bacterium]
MNRFTIFVLMASLTPPLMAQELKQGWVLGESNLYKKPYSDAEVMSRLAADSEVKVIKRKGGWYQVKVSKSRSGWMRMNTLRFGEQSGDKKAGNISGLQQTIKLFKTGRSGSSGVTVATGIRGLDATDLQNSKPNHEALEQLKTFSTDQEGAKSFAAKAKLTGQTLAYIPEEKPKLEPSAPPPEENYWGNDDD